MNGLCMSWSLSDCFQQHLFPLSTAIFYQRGCCVGGSIIYDFQMLNILSFSLLLLLQNAICRIVKPKHQYAIPLYMENNTHVHIQRNERNETLICETGFLPFEHNSSAYIITKIINNNNLSAYKCSKEHKWFIIISLQPGVLFSQFCLSFPLFLFHRNHLFRA